MTRRARILNATFDAVTQQQAVHRLMEIVRNADRGWIVSVNVAILMNMRGNKDLQRFAELARLVIADGQPLVWFGGLLGAPIPERVAGIDLMVELSRRAAADGVPIYLLGAAPGVATAAAHRLRVECPGLIVAGAVDGYFSDIEAGERARGIRESGARILFVGMGAPRQESFIEEHWDALGVNLAIPVGGSFDVLAGRKTRAPLLLQRIGLEWAFRLAQEPRRLFRRYLTTNVRFLLLVVRDLILATVRRTEPISDSRMRP